jgi:hypothetical protein
MGRRAPRPKKFKPKNPAKYVGDLTEITARSSWEMKFMDWCDRNPSVIRWNSEGVVIPYYSQADGKNRRYFVDFIVELKKEGGGKEVVLVEIKPHYQTQMPKATRKTKRYLEECYTYQVNQDKWKHADEYAKKNGFIFRVLDEYDLGIAKRR